VGHWPIKRFLPRNREREADHYRTKTKKSTSTKGGGKKFRTITGRLQAQKIAGMGGKLRKIVLVCWKRGKHLPSLSQGPSMNLRSRRRVKGPKKARVPDAGKKKLLKRQGGKGKKREK